MVLQKPNKEDIARIQLCRQLCFLFTQDFRCPSLRSVPQYKKG